MRCSLVVAVLMLLVVMSFLYVQAQPPIGGTPTGMQEPIKFELDDLVNITVKPNGIAHVKEELRATAATFERLRAMFPTPFTMKRLLESDKQEFDLENISIKYDTMNNKVVAEYDIVGMVVKRGGLWQFLVNKNAKLVSKTGNKLVFTYTYPVSIGKMNTIITVTLPNEASKISVKSDQDYTKVLYNLPSTYGGAGFNPLLLGVLAVLVVLLVANIVLKDGLIGVLSKKGTVPSVPDVKAKKEKKEAEKEERREGKSC